MDRADFAAGQDGLSAKPGRPQRTRRLAAGASPGCPFSWLLLFGQALRRRSGANGGAGPEGAEGRMPGVKRSDRRAGMRDEKHRDVGRLSQQNNKNQRQGTGSRPSPGRRGGKDDAKWEASKIKM